MTKYEELMQFSLSFCYFIPLISSYSYQDHVHRHPESILNVRDRLLQPNRIAGRVLIFVVLDIKQRDRVFWTEWYQAFLRCNLPLIPSWMWVWFVTILKCLNFTTFSEDLLAICMLCFFIYSGFKISTYTSVRCELLTAALFCLVEMHFCQALQPYIPGYSSQQIVCSVFNYHHLLELPCFSIHVYIIPSKCSTWAKS
jgi:hypothetical protein